MIALIVILVIVLAVVVWWIATYNGLVGMKNKVKNAFSQIDVQMQRRFDLIPNLVETVKGYAKHESNTLEEVTKARTNWQSAGTAEEKWEANNMLSNTLKSLFAVSEQYPDLKANQNFMDLQKQLSDTEDKISYMRQSYNDVVMQYNTKIQVFPAMFVANVHHFKEEPLFDAQEGAEQAVKVSF